MSIDEVNTEDWWERTFAEREALLDERFGQMYPPGQVWSFGQACGFGREKALIPGACLHVYPPQNGREHWLYVTVGVSQPADEPTEPVTVDTISGGGCEFAMIVPNPADYVPDLLGGWMAYTLSKPLLVGHFFAGGFCRNDAGETVWFIGRVSDITAAGKELVGEIRGYLFMPLAGAPHWFTTSTGSFELLTTTAITGDEFEYRKKTSSAHLMRLLLDAGVGQVTRIDRPSVLSTTTMQLRADELAKLSGEAVIDGLRHDYQLAVE